MIRHSWNRVYPPPSLAAGRKSVDPVQYINTTYRTAGRNMKVGVRVWRSSSPWEDFLNMFPLHDFVSLILFHIQAPSLWLGTFAPNERPRSGIQRLRCKCIRAPQQQFCKKGKSCPIYLSHLPGTKLFGPGLLQQV